MGKQKGLIIMSYIDQLLESGNSPSIHDDLEIGHTNQARCPWCRNYVKVTEGIGGVKLSCQNEFCPVKPSAMVKYTLEEALKDWNKWKK